MPLVFEWDERKASANLCKHRVSFLEAAAVFTDPLAQIFSDEQHLANEHREIIIGHAGPKKLLIVSFAERRKNVVRIISARRTTRREQRDYEEHIAT